MRSTSDKTNGTKRLRGLAGLTGTGAILIAIVMALSPAATAASANVIHGTPYIGDSFTIQGCAKAKVTKPAISLATGAGRLSMKTQAKTCGATLGGTSVESTAYAESELGALETVKLHSAASTVNVTWNIKALISATYSGSVKNCLKTAPVINDSFSGLFVNGTGGTSYGYINETEQYCTIESFTEFFAETDVEDLTTGVYSYGFNFIADNTTGTYFESYKDTENWTNPLWYYMNYSSSCSACNGTYGTPGSSSISMTSTSLTSGSWSSGDTLQVTTYLYVYGESYLEYAHGKAAAAINGATLGNHVDLAGITIS